MSVVYSSCLWFVYFLHCALYYGQYLHSDVLLLARSYRVKRIEMSQNTLHELDGSQIVFLLPWLQAIASDVYVYHLSWVNINILLRRKVNSTRMTGIPFHECNEQRQNHLDNETKNQSQMFKLITCFSIYSSEQSKQRSDLYNWVIRMEQFFITMFDRNCLYIKREQLLFWFRKQRFHFLKHCKREKTLVWKIRNHHFSFELQ